ncbi:MAG: ABC transporter ATP-binding protein [Gaiellales bacterium]
MNAPAGSSGILSLDRVTKRYGSICACDQVSLEVQAGEFVTLLGPSGSGKTTTLRIVAGFVRPDEGNVVLDERDLTLLPPHKRDIGMVFQHYALFPHMTAGDNVAFPLKMRGVKGSERRQRAQKALELVHLAGLDNRFPSQLSGGQQQRVALARAIVFSPTLLLMDEPLGALDKKLREALQLEISHLSRRLGGTVVYVTHDQEEALAMSDRIAIYNEGRIEQIGTGQELYERPASLFVASFMGESNIFTGRLETHAGGAEVALTHAGFVSPRRRRRLRGSIRAPRWPWCCGRAGATLSAAPARPYPRRPTCSPERSPRSSTSVPRGSAPSPWRTAPSCMRAFPRRTRTT